MKKYIVVTGGAGFVGSNLIELFIKRTNKDIISLDNYSTGSKKNHIKNTIIAIITNGNPERVIGFKEIRYINKIHLMDEFIELFPNTKVICHIDDCIDRQCKSGWFSHDKVSSREELIISNNQMINYSKGNKNCYLSYMKNLFRIDEMNKMFEFLDEELDETKYNYIINNSLE